MGENIKKGDLVLLYDNRHQKFSGKLHTRWMGPYIATEVFSNGSLQLATLQGEKFETRVNGSRVKRYYELPKVEEELGQASSAG